MNRRDVLLQAARLVRRTAEARGNGSLPVSGPAVQVLHSVVPGRVRLAVPGIKRDPEQSQRLETQASAWPGIRRASASAATGNLLLEFDPRQATTEQMVAQAEAVTEQTAAGAGGGGRVRRGVRQDNRTAADAEPTNRRTPIPTLSPPASNEVPASIPAELLAALETALGAAAVIGAGALLLAVRAHGHNLAIDQAPLALAEEIHSPALTALMLGASRLAEPAVLGPVTIGATLLGVGRQRPGDLPWLAPVAVGGGATLISILKVVLRRTRPAAFAHLAPARGYSLPSGHAFLAVCLYGLLAHHGVRWLRARRPDDRRAATVLLTISVAAILLVGISRVYLGVHYPTDVIAGYALALLWLFFLAAINDRRRTANEAMR